MKYDRIINLTTKIAGTSEHLFPIGAVIFKGSRIISLGINKYKTHPLQRNHHTRQIGSSIHAELDALLRSPFYQRKGSGICVVRILKNGSFGVSKPCSSCFSILLDSGIYNFIYFINNVFVKEYNNGVVSEVSEI